MPTKTHSNHQPRVPSPPSDTCPGLISHPGPAYYRLKNTPQQDTILVDVGRGVVGVQVHPALDRVEDTALQGRLVLWVFQGSEEDTLENDLVVALEYDSVWGQHPDQGS